MSIIKRLSVSLFASVDNLVADIENHDALIAAAIKEQAKKIAAGKIQLQRITQQQQAIEQKVKNCQADVARWQARAVREAKLDESKALACLQRYNEQLEQAAKLAQQVENYQTATGQLRESIKQGEQALKAIQQKRDMLKTRESSVALKQSLQDSNLFSNEQMSQSFERWESRLVEGELTTGLHCVETVMEDELELSYVKAEETEALKNQLSNLIADSEGSDNQEQKTEDPSHG